MPLTSKGKKIMSKMRETYGPEKGEEVFYKSRSAGTISGVDKSRKGVRYHTRRLKRTKSV